MEGDYGQEPFVVNGQMFTSPYFLVDGMLKCARGEAYTSRYLLVSERHKNLLVHAPLMRTLTGIYPAWTCFVKGKTHPLTEKEQFFSQKVGSHRKDVER
jgi:hypothetical protein